MTTPTEPLHLVTVRHERYANGDIADSTLTFQCLGIVDSECHLYPECDCDELSPDAVDVSSTETTFGPAMVHRHLAVQHPECWLKSWFDLGAGAAPYLDPDGDGEPIDDLASIPEGSGPINYEYDAAVYWHWVDGPTEPSEASRARAALDAAGYTGLDTEVIKIVIAAARAAETEPEHQEVADERRRQVAKGYDAAHDDQHGAFGLAGMAEGYVTRGVTQGNRSDFIKASALLEAAAASFRRLGHPLGTEASR